MIQVRCSSCGAEFEADDLSAGHSEFCTVCGELNDIPENIEQEEADEPEPIAPEAATWSATPRRDPVAWMWWTLAVLAAAGFAAVCVWLFSDDWEAKHLAMLSAAATRGNAAMAEGDYTEALRDDRLVLTTVGDRRLSSAYLREVVDVCRRDEHEAAARLAARPTSQPVAAASTKPVYDVDAAVKRFQRHSESWADFVRSHTVVVPDGQSWRRQQFIVWDVSYQLQPNSQPPAIVLQYLCNSKSTAPHADQADARQDDDFIRQDLLHAVRCIARFELLDGQWRLISHQQHDEGDELHLAVRNGEIQATGGLSTDQLRRLETQAFR